MTELLSLFQEATVMLTRIRRQPSYRSICVQEDADAAVQSLYQHAGHKLPSEAHVSSQVPMRCLAPSCRQLIRTALKNHPYHSTIKNKCQPWSPERPWSSLVFFCGLGRSRQTTRLQLDEQAFPLVIAVRTMQQGTTMSSMHMTRAAMQADQVPNAAH